MSSSASGSKEDDSRGPTKATSRICLSCGTRPMRYTCPKCNSPVCSKECYQSHSSQCSESFYRENIEADLKSKRPTIEEQQAVKAILEREKLAQASDASLIDRLVQDETTAEPQIDEDELLELAALNLDDPNWMAQLSASQLEKFHRIIASGALDEAIHPWIPWWYRDVLSPKITVIGSENDEQDLDNENEDPSLEPSPSPPILDPIPTLESLTKIKPSPLLANNVLEVLYAYTYTKRLFNGDWEEENAQDALEMVISLSEVLRENAVYKDLKDACRRPMEASLQNSENRVSSSFSVSVLEDVRKIVSHGPTFAMAALSELHDLFMDASRVEIETSAPRPSKASKSLPTISQMQKKLLFMIVWAKECSASILPAVEVGIKAVLSEFDSLTADPSPPAHVDSQFAIIEPTSTKVPTTKPTPKIVELS